MAPVTGKWLSRFRNPRVSVKEAILGSLRRLTIIIFLLVHKTFNPIYLWTFYSLSDLVPRRRIAKSKEKSHPISSFYSPKGINHSTSLLGLLALGILLPGNEALALPDEALDAIEQRAEAETPLPDADGVDEEVDEDPVGDAEGKEDSKVCDCMLVNSL